MGKKRKRGKKGEKHEKKVLHVYVSTKVWILFKKQLHIIHISWKCIRDIVRKGWHWIQEMLALSEYLEKTFYTYFVSPNCIKH